MGLGGNPMPVAQKISVALNISARGSFHGSKKDMCGIAQSATHQCIKEVSNALFRRASDNVHFRTDPNFQAERAIGFGAIAGFPQMQDVIDCAHVTIKAPEHQPGAFINRKGFHTLNVQLVCKQCKWILQICAHFPGSCHNVYILRQSQGARTFTPPVCLHRWILGDKGYLLRTWSSDVCEETRHRYRRKGTYPAMDNTSDHRASHWSAQDEIQVPRLIRWSPSVCPGEGLTFRGGLLCTAQPGATKREALNIEDSEEHDPSSDNEGAEEEAAKHRQMKGPWDNRKDAMRYVQGRLMFPLILTAQL
ncbi:putative nuclease HARBI1 [Heterodontus francisci]|uniref:putative nuclease HARBI1 n=1 Tax=Heterodontus francisci TaxID=7792 RepID=UPI00355B8C7F